MRVLLLHPEDSVLSSPWSRQRWDLVIDLGWAGSSQYADWSEKIGCSVRSLFSFAEWHEDVRRIQDLCAIKTDSLVDSEGIDWWELLAPLRYQQVYELLLLQKILREVDPRAEFFVTHPHRLARSLALLLSAKVCSFITESPLPASARIRHFTKTLRTITHTQIVRIALDKCDTDYRVRRFLSRPRQSSNQSRVLLPTAYRNVSLVLAAYASVLPTRGFLLVTTRADGVLKDLPRNVEAAPLAAYAPVPRNKATEIEISSLRARWEAVRRKLQQAQEPVVALASTLFDAFDRSLRNGLRIRDAWRSVFERERIDSVLSGDENNPYTRLPVLLARHRGMHTIHCGHGALDANISLRGTCSDSYLAKGEMERDYLVKECAVPPERIFVGAPPGSHLAAQGGRAATHIAFFSEPYELYSGRTQTLYQELLPRLCKIAREHRRKVLVKLHPFESLAARSQLVERLLTDEERKLVEVTAEPFSEQLLRRIWFSLTVESSVAVECALAEVPCYLCGWFDIDLYSYGKQYERFGAARILDAPADISRIPELLRSHRPSAAVRNRLYHPITREDLAAVLQRKTTMSETHDLPAR